MPRDCGQCRTLADAGRWNRQKNCQPVCIWAQFSAWERSIYGLWTLCMAGERTTNDVGNKCVRFWVDDGAVRENREGGHPAYRWTIGEVKWEA